ncbi:DNA-binding XRE family transcriptional regulator [Arcicella rosea]|uniref:helix-turn-helix transcriptional regulator n=1 Tax=Arcicella rosea TaxID=502909 RepID=UPI00345E068F
MNFSQLSIILIKNRQSLGLTQTEIAEYIGVAQSTYNNWESGKHKPSIKYLIKICEVYQLKINDLILQVS